MCAFCSLLHSSVAPECVAFAGDNSSNEDPGEEGAGEEDGGKKENKVEGDNCASGELDTVPGDQAADTGEVSEKSDVEVDEEEGRAEDSGKEKEVKSEDFSFPDTTISLTHLQPSR